MEHGITFDHVNVRHSIALLLFKLVVVELILGASFFAVTIFFPSVSVYVFGAAVILKILFTIYIIVDWLDEYYEISETEIGHRKGTFIKHSENVKLEHLTSLRMEQGFLGKMFNYGTIQVHDWFRGRDYFLYQIHNPKKYEAVLTKLMPKADHTRKTARTHLIDDEENE